MLVNRCQSSGSTGLPVGCSIIRIINGRGVGWGSPNQSEGLDFVIKIISHLASAARENGRGTFEAGIREGLKVVTRFNLD
jgi:hypothetical protein